MAEKFGYQRADDPNYRGIENAQKSLNQFDRAVYYPTNWHNSGYVTLMSKFPQFLRYGGLVPVAPEYFQRNYLGIYPIGQQPQVDDGKPYDSQRYS
jgi:hypothetical protein